MRKGEREKRTERVAEESSSMAGWLKEVYVS